MMNTSDMLPALAILLPLLATIPIALTGSRPNLREGISLATATTLFAIAIAMATQTAAGAPPRIETILPMPGSAAHTLTLSLTIEPLGAMFALIASGLWILNTLYSIGYMRANKEHKQTRFYICFALAISAAMGIAAAGDMLTLFVFYEMLTLSTYPLVAHKETAHAKAGARFYLLMLLGTSLSFLLLALAWTYAAADTLAFAPGGILAGNIEGIAAAILLACYAFGIGKAALWPIHGWLPAAMVAPTPVSALLHAVAVVKAGVFTMLKIGVYIFGIDYLAATGISHWLAWLAAFSLLYAAVVAVRQDDIKARLAFSTVSQLSYVTLAMALATPAAALVGGLQIAMHAIGKITLFMCAGSIYTACKRTKVTELNGLGPAMPWTFAAFAVGSLSIIGAPLLGGFWIKWHLLSAAATPYHGLLLAVLLAAALLSLAYLAPILIRAFFLPPPQESPPKETREAPFLCALPPCVSALLCILAFFCAESLWNFLAPIALHHP